MTTSRFEPVLLATVILTTISLFLLFVILSGNA
jgi:hypothetical protein